MPPMDSHLRPHTGSANQELQVPFPSIPTHSRAPVSLRCCCGREDCALLEHNHVALEGLEKDLEMAARLGQVREFELIFAFSWEVDRILLTRSGWLCVPGIGTGSLLSTLFDTSLFLHSSVSGRTGFRLFSFYPPSPCDST